VEPPLNRPIRLLKRNLDKGYDDVVEEILGCVEERYTWRQEPPEEAGWYWMRTFCTTAPVSAEPRVVQIFEDDGTIVLPHTPRPRLHTEFAGPIIKPMDKRDA